MSFLTDFLRKYIVANMEDAEERDARWEKRLRAVHAASQSAYVSTYFSLYVLAPAQGINLHYTHTIYFPTW